MSTLVTTSPGPRLDFGRARPLIIETDVMEPSFQKHRDVALVIPVDRYEGQGVYVLDDCGVTVLRRCSPKVRKGRVDINMTHDNPLYRVGPQTISKAAFAGAVLGRIVGNMSFSDPDAYTAFCARIRCEETPT